MKDNRWNNFKEKIENDLKKCDNNIHNVYGAVTNRYILREMQIIQNEYDWLSLEKAGY